MNLRPFSRRRLLAGMSVASLASALAACGATPTPQVVEKVVKETVLVEQTIEVEKVVQETVEVEKVTTQVVEKEVVVTATPAPSGPVNLVLFVYMEPLQIAAIQSLFSEYSYATPGVTVEAQAAPGAEVDKLQKILLMVAAGTPPDFTWGGNEIHNYAYHKTVIELGPYIQASGVDLSKYNQAFVQAWQYEGKQMGMPCCSQAEILAYNKDLLAADSLAEPPTMWGDSSWDWGTMLEYMKKLTKDTNGDGRTDQWGLAWYLYFNIAVQFWGADWTSPDLARITADTPEMAEGVQELADLSLVHHVAPLGPEWEQFGGQDPFISDMAGFVSFGMWSLEAYTTAQANWALCPWAYVKNGLAPAYPMCFYIFTGSKHWQETWDLLAWLGKPENDLKWGRAFSAMPSFPETVSEWIQPYVDRKPEANLQVMTDLLTYEGTIDRAPSLRHPRFMEMASKVIYPLCDAVWLGEKKAKEVLPEIQRQLEELLASEV